MKNPGGALRAWRGQFLHLYYYCYCAGTTLPISTLENYIFVHMVVGRSTHPIIDATCAVITFFQFREIFWKLSVITCIMIQPILTGILVPPMSIGSRIWNIVCYQINYTTNLASGCPYIATIYNYGVLIDKDCNLKQPKQVNITVHLIREKK